MIFQPGRACCLKWERMSLLAADIVRSGLVSVIPLVDFNFARRLLSALCMISLEFGRAKIWEQWLRVRKVVWENRIEGCGGQWAVGRRMSISVLAVFIRKGASDRRNSVDQ